MQVRATNDEGTSGWSDPGTGTAGSTEAGAIANAPENLQATAGNAEVTLRWDAPNNDSGANITGYAYRYKESGGDFIAYTDIPESGPGEANARSYTVTELTNGLEYVFHVRALNEHGGGLPAEVTVMLPGIVSSEARNYRPRWCFGETIPILSIRRPPYGMHCRRQAKCILRCTTCWGMK